MAPPSSSRRPCASMLAVLSAAAYALRGVRAASRSRRSTADRRIHRVVDRARSRRPWHVGCSSIHAMVRLLSRHFGLVKFAGVGMVVFFAGSALTTHFTSKLLLDVSSVAQAATEADEDPFAGEAEDDEDPATLARAQTAKLNDHALASMAGKGTRKQQSAEGIVAANIFCPTCIPVEDQPVLA